MSVPKGTQEVLDFLAANKPISVAKEELPFSTVLREAILHVAITLHQDNLVLQKEVSNLKAKLGKQSAGMPLNTAGATTPVNAAGTPLNAAATSNAAGDSSPKPEQMPAGSASGASGELHMAAGFSGPVSLVADNKAKNPTSVESAREEKPPHERLCRSMWGYKECPRNNGEECERKHLSICDRPTCYGNVDARATCQERTGKWHGHIKAALVVQKKRERQEAKNRAAQEEQRKFREWQKMQKGPAPGNSAKSKGHKGDPKGRQQKPTQQNGRNGHPGQQRGWKQPGHHQRAQSRGSWEQPRPGPRILGDYFPNLPGPAQPGSVWGNPPPNTAWAPPPAAPTNAQELLLSLKALLNSGVV